jgi:hypothetical protein
MRKSKLINFIKKYNLNGLSEKVKVTCKDNVFMTNFSTEQKDMLGFVAVKDLQVSDNTQFEFGIFNTSGLNKILSALSEDINVSFDSEMNKITSMNVSDSTFETKIMLADLDIIDPPASLQNLPENDITLAIDSNVINNFIKASNAIDSELVAFVKKGDDVNLVVNYAEYNTDTITLKMNVVKDGDIPPMKFNSTVLKEVLSANKDCTEGTIELSSAGLMTLKFKGTDYSTKYLLVMIQ